MVRRMMILTLLLLFAETAFGQFIGYSAQQTVTKSFGVAAGAPTPQAVISLPNYGQAGHSVEATWTLGGDCALLLQGSADGQGYITLLANPKTSSGFGHVAFGSGYFPYLRIVVNPGTEPGCTSGVTGTYTGFQYPMPSGNISKTFALYNITTPAQLNLDVGVDSPFAITGFQCFNNTGATAYLQIADASIAPTLGNFIVYQMPILNQATFSYPGRDAFMIFSIGWAGASTALGGGVAIAAGLNCNFQVNYRGPFYPFGSQ